MHQLKERSLFLKQAFKDIHEVGSIAPSSQATAKAMTEAFRGRTQPARVLEVGAGTGPITVRLVKEMRPGDQLDVYEINPEYSTFLENRFKTEPAFQRVSHQCQVVTAGIETIEKAPTYDYIISAIPFTAFPAEAVRNFFEIYRAILKPTGVLTYIEYAFGRSFMRAITKDPAQRDRLNQVGQIVTHYIENYQFRHRFVLLNAPPARIRSLRFK